MLDVIPGCEEGFLPSQIAGLGLWLDAGVGVTEAGTGVSVWADRSVNGYDFIQTVDGNRPTLVASEAALNNQPLIRFTAANSDYLIHNAVPFTTDNTGTFFFVAKNTTAASAFYIFCHSTNANNANFLAWWLFDNASVNNSFAHDSEILNITDRSYGDTALGTANYGVISMTCNGTSYGLRINGVAQTVNGTNNGEWMNDQSIAQNHMACGALVRSGVTGSEGDIAEILYYSDTILTAPQILEVESYLNTKYNVY